MLDNAAPEMLLPPHQLCTSHIAVLLMLLFFKILKSLYPFKSLFLVITPVPLFLLG